MSGNDEEKLVDKFKRDYEIMIDKKHKSKFATIKEETTNDE